MDMRQRLQLCPLLRLAVALLVGIVVADGAGKAVTADCWLWLAVAALALAAGASWLRDEQGAWTQGTLLLLTTFFVGATLMGQARSRLRVALPPGPVDYAAVVVSEPQVKGKTARMDLLVTHVCGRKLPRPVSVRASLLRDTVSSRWQQLHVGSGIRAYSVVEPLRAVGRTGHFDYVRWCQVHGYQAQTFVYYRNWEPAVPAYAALSTLQRARLRMLIVRQGLLQRYRALGLDDQQYAVIAAMTLGDKSALSKATRDTYAVTGASHVLALSGLHLGIVYAVLTFLIGGRRRRLWVGQALVLCAVWSYAVLVGLSASVVRSATMLTVCSVSLLLHRDSVSVNTLAFAALVMLVANPLNLWDVGFQLSFLAVLGIIVYERRIYRLWCPRARLLRWAWATVTVSLAAQMATAPLVAYYFGRFPCYFLLTNFLVVPAATVILYGALLLLLTFPFAAVSRVVAMGLVAVVGGLNDALSAMSAWPGASVEGIRLSGLQVVVVYVMMLSLTVIAEHVARLRHLHALDVFNGARAHRPRSDSLPVDEDMPDAYEP